MGQRHSFDPDIRVDGEGLLVTDAGLYPLECSGAGRQHRLET